MRTVSLGVADLMKDSTHAKHTRENECREREYSADKCYARDDNSEILNHVVYGSVGSVVNTDIAFSEWKCIARLQIKKGEHKWR